jgi:hypothetical protein
MEPNFNRGNLILADGQLIVLDGETGELFLVEPSPEEFKPISNFEALEPKKKRGNKIWAPMALSDGLLIVRDQQEMKCFNLRADAYATVQ